MQSKRAGQLIKSRIKDVFRMYDTSGDGELDMYELHRAFKVLGPNFSNEDISGFVAEIDESGDGTVSYKEFLKWLKRGSRGAKFVSKVILAAGDARAAKIQATFQRFDTSGDGSLNMAEMEKLLRIQGPFSGLEVKCICKDLDKGNDGEISYDEFVKWFKSDLGGRDIAKAKAVLAPTDEDGLEGVFYNFCGAGHVDMDCSRFLRLCEDAGFVNDTFTKLCVDRIWCADGIKPKNLRRRIGFQQFEAALELVAERKGITTEQVRSAVVKTERPTFLDKSFPVDEHARLYKIYSKSPVQKMEERRNKQRAILMSPYDPTPSPRDNTELWKVFGVGSQAGRVLKRLYSPQPIDTPRTKPIDTPRTKPIDTPRTRSKIKVLA